MYAIDLLNQFQDYNGTVLSNGKMYVYFLGRVALANVYHDIDGQVPIPNPVELDNLGMAQVYVSNAHDYTIVLTDVYGNEMFSRDLFVNGSAEGGGNARLYEGIDPIVVNNEQNIISAKLANLGVESPLYFIEDTEESTVIGVSGDFASVSASANLTAYKEDDVTWISGKDWSTDITNASANAYEQATANDYRPLFEGNNGKISAIDNSAILIPDVVDYSAGANINISNHVVSLDTAVELTDILRDRGAILDPSGLYVSNLQQTTYTEIGKDHVFSTDGSASIGWQLGNKAISIGDNSGNGDYRNLILGLDDVLLEERHQEPTPVKVYSLTGACESALSAINMINSGDNQAYSAGANINITDHVISGKDWSTEIGDKLDATAFSTVSGDFLTSLPADLVYTGDITGKADTTALTAYLTTADSAQFYTNDNPSGFITGVDLSNYATTADVTAKLDTTAFSDVSGSFLTAHQSLDGLMSADLLEFSGAVITAYSGCKFAGEISGDAGDAEVNALVHSNSGEWNSAYSGLVNSTTIAGINGKYQTTNAAFVNSTALRLISANCYTEYSPNSWDDNATVYVDVPEYSGVKSFVYNFKFNGYSAIPEYMNDGTKLINSGENFATYISYYRKPYPGEASEGGETWFLSIPKNTFAPTSTDISAYVYYSAAGNIRTIMTENNIGYNNNYIKSYDSAEFVAGNYTDYGEKKIIELNGVTNFVADKVDDITFNAVTTGEQNFRRYDQSPLLQFEGLSSYSDNIFVSANCPYANNTTNVKAILYSGYYPMDANRVWSARVDFNNDISVFNISGINAGELYILTLPVGGSNDYAYLYTSSFSAEQKTVRGVEIPNKSDFVPTSAFNELKQSYDALSSLFSTYSGQWLLPNTGV